MAHDFVAQRAETYAAFADLAAEAELPGSADIDYAFLPSAAADWQGALAALADEGYVTTRVEDDDDWLEATLPDQPLSALAIWLGEETATRIALAHGFQPDGWGFAA